MTTDIDVVVIGMGGAGLSAAISAHDAGARVLVLEKAPAEQSGGNSRVSGQVWFSPTDVELAKLYLNELAWEYPIPEPIVTAWAEETAQNDTWVEERIAEVRGRVARDRDDPYDGDGSDISRISWGALRAYTGVTDSPEHEFHELRGNDCGTEYHMIGGSMGFSRLWLLLTQCLTDRSIQVRYSTRAVDILRDHRGSVAGVIVEDSDGERSSIEAAAIIVASGGFANNSEMARNFLRLSYTLPWGSPFNAGDGIVMAQKLGTDLAHPYNYMASPGIAMPPYPTGEAALSSGDRFITIGADGRRFMDETKRTRHGKIRVRGMFDFFPSVPMWTIFDEDGRLNGPLVIPRDKFAVGWAKLVERYEWSDDNSAEIERGWIVRADSVGELATKLGIDRTGLENELRRYNSWVLSGIDDPIFGRVAASMSPITRPPFYGFKWAQMIITTLGGIRKDEHARALDPDGEPIPGLYSAGDVASTYTWSLSGGLALADALAFGRIAGSHAAKLTTRSGHDSPRRVDINA